MLDVVVGIVIVEEVVLIAVGEGIVLVVKGTSENKTTVSREEGIVAGACCCCTHRFIGIPTHLLRRRCKSKGCGNSCSIFSVRNSSSSSRRTSRYHSAIVLNMNFCRLRSRRSCSDNPCPGLLRRCRRRNRTRSFLLFTIPCRLRRRWRRM